MRIYRNDAYECEINLDDTSMATCENFYLTGRSSGGNGQLVFTNVTYNKEVSVEDAGILDFNFPNERSVMGYTGERGTVSYDNGLKFTFADENAKVTTPAIEAARGTHYSALLTVKNTIVVRMKNDSASDKVNVYFANDEGYSDSKCVTFDILPNSDYTTYFFNLSKNQFAEGYLRGFALEFLNATSGSVTVSGVKFSREDAYYEYAGSIESCTATTETVTIVGKLDSKYAGKKVTVYRTEMENYLQALDYKGGLEVLAECTAGADGFTATLPFMQGKMTHLSTYFIVAVDGVKVSKAFQIENYEDFTSNPYTFETRNYSVSVLDFGAVGDSFTNDNDAFQAAIDAVSEAGGGKVIVPGNDSEYGRRYVLNGIVMKSNVELVIEKGAMLLQSENYDDYDYPLYFGHSNMGQGVAWGISSLMHDPFIFIKNAKNVKITGGGTIRMTDIGSECLDGNGCVEDGIYYSDNIFTVGCTSNVHLVPVAIFYSENVEIKDTTIQRSNGWHFYGRESNHVYFGNVKLEEINCLNADGFDFTNDVHDVMINRCSIYSNDDAFVACVTINDPRDDVSPWRKKTEQAERSVYNFTILHCNLFGGHGITIIPWASEAPNAENVEIRDIYVEDCILDGYSSSVGAWSDNPYYGESNFYLGTYGSLEAAETDDYSPVRNLTIINNRYDNICSFFGINVTNLITDCGAIGARDLQNANFDKVVKYDGEEDFVTALSYWQREGNVGTAYIDATYGYSAFVKTGTLSQGVYRMTGVHSFTIDAKLLAGRATMFVKDKEGNILAEKALTTGTNFEKYVLEVELMAPDVVFFGVSHEGSTDEGLWLDNAALKLERTPMYDIVGEELIINFDVVSDLTLFDVFAQKDNVTVTDGALTVGNEDEYKIILDGDKVTDFKLSVDIYPEKPNGEINAGVYVLTNGKLSAGFITAINVQVEKAKDSPYYLVNIYGFDEASGYLGKYIQSSNLNYDGEKVTLTVIVKAGMLFVFVDNGVEHIIEYTIGTEDYSGYVGFRTWLNNVKFDNFHLVAAGYDLPAGNRYQLEKVIAQAEQFNKQGYTEESFAALQVALNAAKELRLDAPQKEIDEVKVALEQAILGLVKVNAADELSDFIAEIETTITAENIDSVKEDIIIAKATYNNLTDEEKAQVTNYSKLATLEEIIAEFEKPVVVAPSEEVIAFIAEIEDVVTAENYQTVKAYVILAKEMYNELSDEEKAKVTNYEKLATLEAAIAALEAPVEEPDSGCFAGVEMNSLVMLSMLGAVLFVCRKRKQRN